MPKPSHHRTETSDLLSLRTGNVFEQLSHCSTDDATSECFRNSPPYSGVLAEQGYPGMDSDTTINASTSVQAPKLLPHRPTLSSGYIKSDIFFDSANQSIELPRVSTTQCYNDNNEISASVPSQCRSELMEDYVDADFSLSDSKYLPGSAHVPGDIHETGGESASLHDLFGSRFAIEEIHNSSSDSCSPSEQSSRTTSPCEENEDTVRYEQNISPKYNMSDSECGYNEFQSIIRQDIVLDQNASQQMQNQPNKCDACALTPDLYQHRRQINNSADQYMDPHFNEDTEAHGSRSDQLTRLSKCHGSASSIDSGYVRTCEFS